MGALFFLVFFCLFMYRTSGQNIQILRILKIFSELCYNKTMDISDMSIIEKYDGPMCCAECTCAHPHSSIPPLEEQSDSLKEE